MVECDSTTRLDEASVSKPFSLEAVLICLCWRLGDASRFDFLEGSLWGKLGLFCTTGSGKVLMSKTSPRETGVVPLWEWLSDGLFSFPRTGGADAFGKREVSELDVIIELIKSTDA